MSETFQRRHPVDEAAQVIKNRFDDGWWLLGMEGLWVDDAGARPDLDFIFDGSPGGVQDLKAVTAILATWPRNEAFCVEVPMVR